MGPCESDAGALDAGMDGGLDAGMDGGRDGGVDASVDAGVAPDGGVCGSEPHHRVFASAAGRAMVHDIVVTPDGGVVVAGEFTGTLVLDRPLVAAGIEPDAFVAMLDSAGSVLWSQRFGDDRRDLARSVARLSDGDIVVAVSYHGAPSVTLSAETTPNLDGGCPRPTPDAGPDDAGSDDAGPDDAGSDDAGPDDAGCPLDGGGCSAALPAAPTGSVACSGATLNCGGADSCHRSFIARLRGEDGGVRWATEVGLVSISDAFSPAQALAVDPSDRLVVAGTFVCTSTYAGTSYIANRRAQPILLGMSPHGVPTWASDRAFDNFVSPNESMDVAASAAGIYAVGQRRLKPYVMHTSECGVDLGPLGVTETEGTGRMEAVAIGNERVFAAGWFEDAVTFAGGSLTPVVDGTSDAFLVRYATDLRLEASVVLSGGGEERVNAIAVAPAACGEPDIVVVVGTYSAPFDPSMGVTGVDLPAIGRDAFIAAYRWPLTGEAIEHVWSRRLGGTADDDLWAVGAAPSGDLLVGGGFAGASAELVEATATSTGAVSGVVQRFAPPSP